MILGNGPAAKGAHGESHEPHGIVIRCNPVGAYVAADRTPVQDGPFAVFSHPHADGFQDASAWAVRAGQAVGTVIPGAAGRCFRGLPSADGTFVTFYLVHWF